MKAGFQLLKYTTTMYDTNGQKHFRSCVRRFSTAPHPPSLGSRAVVRTCQIEEIRKEFLILFAILAIIPFAMLAVVFGGGDTVLTSPAKIFFVRRCVEEILREIIISLRISALLRPSMLFEKAVRFGYLVEIVGNLTWDSSGFRKESFFINNQ